MCFCMFFFTTFADIFVQNKMKIEEHISAFAKLAACLKVALEDRYKGNQKLRKQIAQEQNHNAWFVPFFVKKSIEAIIQMLDEKQLTQWILPYKNQIENRENSLQVGVVMAGNIPLVGFHDFLSVLITGHTFLGKLSSQDAQLLPIIAEMLCKIDPRFTEKIRFCNNNIRKIDRLIATGNNKTANYMEYYFQNTPSIVRRHCNSIAILDGNESEEDLINLADDVFLYFGLGCRNVSKIYIPRKYNFEPLFAAFNSHKKIMNKHNKYLNNLDYQKTVHLLNAVPFLDQGFIICKENTDLNSPISVLHYQYYDDLDMAVKEIALSRNEIQCVASNALQKHSFVRLGQTQFPTLHDYANGINTLEFLLK